ncbi:heme-binding protein [Chthoniobacter flavus Ellin428]|uniref:Heme-binding protein n=1 Tax=Chthoniobacter flavus Ellin428 TaxID=497964 RepID=B4CZM5_9BACT|nr:c-type cytochrome [Chthoniobacter flavus]EDY20189.1 heme-binding protein [Chthoniobacter flavus Ellin428]TCO94087.1 putative heme-binding domain-containing protein [Chthoniobacter flavus]
MRLTAPSFVLAVALGLTSLAQAQAPQAPAKKAPKPKDPDAGKQINENKATPAERIKVMKDFKVELLYSVPIAEQGSWVAMCVDNKGRLITSDQYGSLYRFTPPPAGQPLDPKTIERLDIPVKAANGLLWAFNALWVGVNDYEHGESTGLYRVTASKGDDHLDTVEQLRSMKGRGDHGVHAVLPGPDGKSVFLITGDGTTPTEFNRSRVPTIWGEDHLLPRLPDGRGFMRDVLAPGGIIYKISADGKDWEVWSSGYRNIYDGAFDKNGELFTYDADMEYDFNTPWYRPTRICHCVSGSEFGWRNGAGKRAEWYPDNLPPVLNIGPGSPTGMVFGYGAKFPAKYQSALFALDWSWGRLYAVHLQPNGATFSATKEDFLNGAPLPMTDVVINPNDGAMYFTIGGRKVQSGLYRVTYTGKESTAPAPAPKKDAPAIAERHRLEEYHHEDTGALTVAWPKLGDNDRFIRWAARTAVEHQPVATWADKALSETDPAKQLEALLALARCAGIDPQHRKPTDPPVDTAMRDKLLTALQKFDWSTLNQEQRLTLVRTLQIALVRFGRPDDATVKALLAKFDPLFPAPTYEQNRLLCETLVYLQSPTIAAKAVPMLTSAPTQEEQMEYARSLRMLKTGWTTPLHTAYFDWFLKAANYRGGASFENFIAFIRADAVASLSDSEKTELAAELDKKPVIKSPLEVAASALVGHTKITNWTLDDVNPPAALTGRNYETGHKMFAAVGCSACHRFGNEGGMTGPDLTQAGGRYSPRDLIDNIINPSKEINEQFVPTVITMEDGTQHIGMIVNLNSDGVSLNTDPTQPNQQEHIDRRKVVKIEPSKVSLMPPGLLNILSRDEVLDLAAYVLSGGDEKNAMFTKK